MAQRKQSCSLFCFSSLVRLATPYEVPPSWRQNIRNHGYDTALAYEDEVIGRFWKFLVQQDLVAKSLIVFTSDHGESLGEHSESTHGYFIYQSTLRVPLLIHWPAGTKTFTPRVDEPASLLDLAPTILQFLGLPVQPQFQGRGLMGLVYRQGPGIPSEIYSESLYARNHFGSSSLRGLQVGRYKYIEAPTPEFYDLCQDPGETRNLYSQYRALALSYRERLVAVRSRFQTSGAVRSRALTPEAVAALSSLGYAAASGSPSTITESGIDPKDRIKDSESYGRAVALAASGRITEANARLVLLCSKFPEISDTRISLGVNHQKLGRHVEAAKKLSAGLEA
jgi:choline-sulfatase